MAIVEGDFDKSAISHPNERGATSATSRPSPGLMANWSQKAQRLRKEAHVFYFAIKDPRTPWYARLVAACTAGYLISPIQLIPSFIPYIGFLDDLVVLFLGVKLLKKITPAEVLEESRALADAAETRRKEEVGWAATWVPVAVALLWITAAIGGSLLVASHFRR